VFHKSNLVKLLKLKASKPKHTLKIMHCIFRYFKSKLNICFIKCENVIILNENKLKI